MAVTSDEPLDDDEIHSWTLFTGHLRAAGAAEVHSMQKTADKPVDDTKRQHEALRAIVVRHARDPHRLAILMCLHLEGGSAEFHSLRTKYGLPQIMLDVTLAAMRTAGLVAYDGRTISIRGGAE